MRPRISVPAEIVDVVAAHLYDAAHAPYRWETAKPAARSAFLRRAQRLLAAAWPTIEAYFQADQDDDDEDAQSDAQVMRGLAQDLIEAYKTGQQDDVAFILAQLENLYATGQIVGMAAQIADGTKQ